MEYILMVALGAFMIHEALRVFKIHPHLEGIKKTAAGFSASLAFLLGIYLIASTVVAAIKEAF